MSLMLSKREIADIFNVELAEVEELLSKFSFGPMPSKVSKEIIWKLIVAGAQSKFNTIDKIAEEWQEVRNKRNRTPINYSQRQRIIERDKNKCRYCGKKVNKNTRVIDHVQPWSRGGRNTDDNLVVACRTCNSEKSDKTLMEWGKEMLPIPS